MKSNFNALPIILCLLFSVSACDPGKNSSNTNEQPSAEGNDYLVTIKTDLGEMKAILYDQTPKHKENFIKLAKEGFFDSLLFHRVINGFMIQGGDPESRHAKPRQPLGSGGPDYTIPAEFVPTRFHEKGVLAAARKGDQVNPEKASSGSQFYIVQGRTYSKAELEEHNRRMLIEAARTLMEEQPNHALTLEYKQMISENPNDVKATTDKLVETADRLAEATGMNFTIPEDRVEKYSTVGGTPFLDDNYTVFGKVISGIAVVDTIANVQTAPGDRPVEDVRMYISVEEVPRTEIEKKFGYKYPKILPPQEPLNNDR